jgi:hypothetical protein
MTNGSDSVQLRHAALTVTLGLAAAAWVVAVRGSWTRATDVTTRGEKQ